MAEETQYTANTGLATISTANANLDGTGSITNLILPNLIPGLQIKTISIKATGNTTHGMIRVFVSDVTTNRLLQEIDVPAVTSSSIDPTFETTVNLDYDLDSNHWLKVSTQNAESFNVIAEGMDWDYYASSVRTDTTKYTAVTGMATISAASTKVLLLTAGLNGCSVESITVKATESPVDGIISLYIYNGSTYYLFKEIKVTAVTKSSIAESYEYTMVFENDFELQSGYSLYVATMQAQLFRVTAEGLNWEYPA